MYKIVDWTGDDMHLGEFETAEDAHDKLIEHLGEDYETDKQEYYVMKMME